MSETTFVVLDEVATERITKAAGVYAAEVRAALNINTVAKPDDDAVQALFAVTVATAILEQVEFILRFKSQNIGWDNAIAGVGGGCDDGLSFALMPADLRARAVGVFMHSIMNTVTIHTAMNEAPGATKQ